MEDVNFRQISKKDLEKLRTWRNLKSISQYMFSNQYITKENQMLWFERIQKDNNNYYWVIDFNGEAVGYASLQLDEMSDDTYSFGLYVGNTNYKGRKVGPKILYNIIEYAFNKLNAHKLCCSVLSFNERAISMYKKFGFIQQSYLKDYLKRDSKRFDCIGYAMFEDYWKQHKLTHFNSIYDN